jgi:hypothetical protein
MRIGGDWLTAALLLSATVPAAACSPPPRSETNDVEHEPAALLARFSLAAGAGPVTIERPASCAGGTLVVEVRDRSSGSGAKGAYLLVVEAVGPRGVRRVAAHTPYPVGSDGRFVLAEEACAAERLRFEAQPIHGPSLPGGLSLEIELSRASRASG